MNQRKIATSWNALASVVTTSATSDRSWPIGHIWSDIARSASAVDGREAAFAAVGAGAIRDVTGEYTIAWMIAASLCVVAVAVSWSINRAPSHS